VNTACYAVIFYQSIIGLLTKSGYFFDFVNKSWARYPSAGLFTELSVNALFTFQGKATIFGTSESFDDSSLPKDVRQFQEDKLDWISIGNLLEARVDHYVIEVPASFCNAF